MRLKKTYFNKKSSKSALLFYHLKRAVKMTALRLYGYTKRSHLSIVKASLLDFHFLDLQICKHHLNLSFGIK